MGRSSHPPAAVESVMRAGVLRAALVVALGAGLVACGETASAPTGSAATSPAGSQADASPSTSPVTVSKQVRRESTPVAAYGLPTLLDFARARFVTGVVTGTVTRTRTEVLDDAYVATFVTIETDGLDGLPKRTVVTREYGGVVRLEQVRADVAGHVPDGAIDAQQDQLVEYVGDVPRSAVGQRVFVLMAGRTTDPAGRFSAATMVLGDDGAYHWPGESPNDRWASAVTRAEVARLAGLVSSR